MVGESLLLTAACLVLVLRRYLYFCYLIRGRSDPIRVTLGGLESQYETALRNQKHETTIFSGFTFCFSWNNWNKHDTAAVAGRSTSRLKILHDLRKSRNEISHFIFGNRYPVHGNNAGIN